MYTSLPEMWEGWTKNIYLGLRDRAALLWLGVFGAFLAFMASVFLPVWSLLGLIWYVQDGSWMALAVLLESLALWTHLVLARARVARGMEISPFYALTTPLGAGIFGAMMFASAWRVVSRKGVTWKGRTYQRG